MRLIDANELKLSHCKECTLYPDKCLKDKCDWNSIYHINHAKTVEAIPVEWLLKWLLKWNKAQARRGLCIVLKMIKDWREENGNL